MILATAQTRTKRGDVKANLLDHYRFIELASQHHAELVVFPEMSITGYERDKAREMAFTENDPRLDHMRNLSAHLNITVLAGAPILLEEKLYIGTVIIKPDSNPAIYTKQYLHEGEEEWFHYTMKYNPLIKYNSERISLAVCADINHSGHAEKAAGKNTTVYIASIFSSAEGLPSAYQLLSGYAKQYNMNVLMSNYCGPAWEIDAGGGSCFWDQKGNLVDNLNDFNPGLLIVEKRGETWEGMSIIDYSDDSLFDEREMPEIY